MKGNKSQNPTLEQEMSETLQNRVSDFVEEYGKQTLIGFTIFLIALVLLYRLSSGTQTQAINEYLAAEQSFQSFNDNPVLAEDSLFQLEGIMKQYPNLHTKYAAPVAQILFGMDQTNQALPLAKSSIESTHFEQLPFYRDYSSTTLQIETNLFTAALQSTDKLQEELNSNKELGLTHPEKQTFGPRLYASNLIRTALIHNKLGNTQEELTTWEALSIYLETPEIKEEVQPLLNTLRSGTFTFEQFIAARKAELVG